MKMAMDLLNHELEYAYLFTDSAFSEFLPTPAQKERIASFEKKNKEHFETVKAIVMTKPCAK